MSTEDLEFTLSAVVNLARRMLCQPRGQGWNCLKLRHPDARRSPEVSLTDIKFSSYVSFLKHCDVQLGTNDKWIM